MNVVEVAACGTVAVVGVTLNEQAGGGAAAACVIVAVCPATVIVPDRLAPVFAATDSATLPLPVPLAPAVIEIHVAFVVAVHAQPDPAVTVSGVAVPPDAAIDCAPGATANVQPGGGGVVPVATCDTTIAAPATCTTAVRAAPLFAPIDRITVALPMPDAVDAVTHDAPAAVCQLHAELVVTEISKDPPPACTVTSCGDTE